MKLYFQIKFQLSSYSFVMRDEMNIFRFNFAEHQELFKNVDL